MVVESGCGLSDSLSVSSSGFDCLARSYRGMEWLLAGNKLQKCRIQFLPEISAARKVLLLGEGHGRFLRELIRRNSNAQITCLDSSARMLAVTRRALLHCGFNPDAVQFVHANVLERSLPSGPFDAVATHFFLDCFTPEQHKQIVAEIASNIAPGGAWLLADFRQPERGFERWRATIILKLMYAFFRGVTKLPARNLTDPDPYLQQSGFVLINRRLSEWGLLHTDLWRKS